MFDIHDGLRSKEKIIFLYRFRYRPVTAPLLVLVIVDPDRRSNRGWRSNKDRDPLFFWIAIEQGDRDRIELFFHKIIIFIESII